MISLTGLSWKNFPLPVTRHLYNCNHYGRTVLNLAVISTRVIKHYSDNSSYGRQLGGFEYKEEIQPLRSIWRKPLLEREGFERSKFALFGNNKFPGDILRYNPQNFKFMSFRKYLHKKQMEKLMHDQQFVEERLNILGCDLAAAHFIVYRGGAVKFCNISEWIKDDKTKKSDYDDDLPNSFDPNYVLEAIDLSGTKIIYEGLINIKNLKMLKWISFASCPYFDTWCLDKVSGELGETVEHVDISYTNIPHHGLSALYRFKNLKTLTAHGLLEDPEFFLTCQELKKAFPELTVNGDKDQTQEPVKMLEAEN